MSGYSEVGSSRFSESHSRDPGAGGGGGGMAFSDDFMRADGPIGAPWEVPAGAVNIVSDVATVAVVASGSQAYVNVGTDQGTVTIDTPDSTAPVQHIYVIIGGDGGDLNSTGSGCVLVVPANSGQPLVLYDVTAGAFTSIASGSDGGYSAGSTFSLVKTGTFVDIWTGTTGNPLHTHLFGTDSVNTGDFTGIGGDTGSGGVLDAPIAAGFTFTPSGGAGSHDYGAHPR